MRGVSNDAALARAFHARTDRPPVGVWAAPGRVNLIGEHTDYNDGYVMPFALAHRVLIAAAPRQDGTWSVTSLNNDSTKSFQPADLQPGMSGWQAYVAGVVWALQEAGHQVGGTDMVLTSDVPEGAGLSSSAALECAVLTALVDLNDLDIAGLERAKLARRAENAFVGAPTGLMDQAAATLCTVRHALFFDCRTDDAEQVRFDATSAGLEILVLDTKTPHALVDSEYAARRASCEEAARLLGVPALRDVTDLDAALDKLPDPVIQRRVRHVITENARVLEAVKVLRTGRIADLAPAPRRLAQLDAGRLRDHSAAGGPCGRNGPHLRSPWRSDDRRRFWRLHHCAGPGRRSREDRTRDRPELRNRRIWSAGALHGRSIRRRPAASMSRISSLRSDSKPTGINQTQASRGRIQSVLRTHPPLTRAVKR